MVYAQHLPADEDMPLMAKLTEFFCTRLVKKCLRRENPFVEVEGMASIAGCVQEFRELTHSFIAVQRRGVVSAARWEEEWDAFSNKWIAVSHWVCPVRLAEFLHDLGVTPRWEGTLSERRRTPPQDFLKKKDKKERATSPSHSFFCRYCSVLCNSQAQIDVHRQGARHRENIASLERQVKAKGLSFTEAPPQLIVKEGVSGGEAPVASTPSSCGMSDALSCSSGDDVIEDSAAVSLCDGDAGTERSPQELASLLLGIQHVLAAGQ